MYSRFYFLHMHFARAVSACTLQLDYYFCITTVADDNKAAYDSVREREEVFEDLNVLDLLPEKIGTQNTGEDIFKYFVLRNRKYFKIS